MLDRKKRKKKAIIYKLEIEYIAKAQFSRTRNAISESDLKIGNFQKHNTQITKTASFIKGLRRVKNTYNQNH